MRDEQALSSELVPATSAFQRIEALVALMGAMLISAVILLGVWFTCCAVYFAPITRDTLPLLILILVAGPAECVTLRSLFRRIKRVDLAIEDVLVGHPNPRLVSRVLLPVWWLLHFVLAAIFSEWYVQVWHPNIGSSFWGFRVQTIVVCFLAAVASNFFLLLALSALGTRPQSLQTLWRFRFAIDLILALASTALSFPLWLKRV